MGARQYDPALGRFIALDPQLDQNDPTSLNGYSYADNDPIGREDPTGLYQTCGGSPCPGSYNSSGSLIDPVCTAGCTGGTGVGSGGGSSSSGTSVPTPATGKAACSYGAANIVDDCQSLAHSDLPVWVAEHVPAGASEYFIAKAWSTYGRGMGSAGDYWNPSTGYGPACWGMDACHAAYQYLLNHLNDTDGFAKAEIIAATYCVQHYESCLSDGEAHDTGSTATLIPLFAGALSAGVAEDVAAVTADESVAAEDDSLAGVDRGDGRDVYGRFTGKGGYGASGQAQGLADYTTATGRDVINDQVRARLPDGSTRYYDGLSLGPDGTYQGVEVKSGTAGLTGSQRAFDSQVDGGAPATAMLGGSQISITSTYLVRVP